MTSAQMMTEENRNRLYWGFTCIQAALIIQIIPLLASQFIWRVIFAMPGQVRWLQPSVSMALISLKLLVLLLVFRGTRLIGYRSELTFRLRTKLRLIYVVLILLITWKITQLVDCSLLIINIVALPRTQFFSELVAIGRALLWFIVLFNGILIAVTVNNHLGKLRFSKPTLISMLGVSLLLWLTNTSYMMYMREFDYQGWAFFTIRYGTTSLSFVWLIGLVILLGKVRRKITRLIHCPNCDYNLTGNTSGVCPECGETVSGTLSSVPDYLPVSPVAGT